MGNADVCKVTTAVATSAYQFAQARIKYGVEMDAHVLQASLAIILTSPVCRSHAELIKLCRIIDVYVLLDSLVTNSEFACRPQSTARTLTK